MQIGKVIKQSVATPSYASRDEVEATIRSLSTGDRKKLMVSAIFWWRKFGLEAAEMSPDDLLQEALFRALKEEDARRWPKHISFNKFISRSMESIASHHKEKSNFTENATETDDLPIDESSTIFNPENQIHAKKMLENLKNFFGQDNEAYNALTLKAYGMDAIEIREELQVSESDWEAIRKRIQRKLAVYLRETKEE